MTEDPKDALASIQSARAGMTGNLSYPFTYDLACGACLALLVGTQGLPSPWSMVGLALAMAGLAGCVQWWRKRFGWWVNGYSPKRAGRVAYAMAGLLALLVGVGIWGRGQEIAWIPFATAAAAFVLSILGGRLWMHVWKRELEADQG